MEQRVNPLNTSQGKQTGTNTGSASRQRIAGQQNPSSQSGRTVGISSNYGIARGASSLHVGDVLRGEITDLRNNEISITLENNTIVRGRIQDSATYAIGQTRAFRLIDISGGTLYLENISKGYSDTELTLINKALDEANLPPTEHNQATVKALMDNLLPINRDSIQNLMQQAFDYHTSDMNTLAVMNRLMMEINEDSIQQFSNYRNNNYQLLERLQNFSRDIPSLLSALAENSNADAVAAFGKSLLSIGLSSSNAGAPPATLASLSVSVQDEIMTMLSGASLTEDTVAQLQDGTLSLQDAMTLIRDAAANGTLTLPENLSSAQLAEQLTRLQQALEPLLSNPTVITEDSVKNSIQLNEAAVMETVEEQMEQNTADAAEEDTAQKSDNRFAFAGRLLQTISQNAKNTISGTLDALKGSPAGAENTPHIAENSALDTLIKEYETHSRNYDLLNTYLSANERDELANQLQAMPISRTMLMKIASGEATTKEVLTVIYNTISLTDSKQIRSLFRSDAFKKLFARDLQSSWTMTPEQMQEGKLSEFYSKMHSQMQQYRHLIQSTLSGQDSSQLNGFAKDIEQNISFMKTLNETFSYFQLPLKLPSQDAHGDLYVYTKKERLRQNPNKTSVLLHLDMEHLGMVDIKIDKNMQEIKADFSVNDQDSVQLLDVNSSMLKDALNLLGYQCQIKIQQREQPSPTVDDFINTKVNTHATTEMKRFSFDIRA